MDIFISAVSGGMIAIGLVVAYIVNARTQEKVRHGSPPQKLIAYSLRIGAVLAAYVVVLLSAKTMHTFTGTTVFDALIFFASLVGILLLARRKQRQGDAADKRTRTER